jgi:hypothetical protein
LRLAHARVRPLLIARFNGLRRELVERAEPSGLKAARRAIRDVMLDQRAALNS